MNNEQAIKVLLDEWKCIDRNDGINCDRQCEKCDLVMDSAILKDAYNMAIKALEQEPCELLIIKSDILLHQDDRKTWVEQIKREKESGVIILPPYFEPLLVPNDIEISIEQEPSDTISREALIAKLTELIKTSRSTIEIKAKLIPMIQDLPSVTPTCEEREKGECPYYAR